MSALPTKQLVAVFAAIVGACAISTGGGCSGGTDTTAGDGGSSGSSGSSGASGTSGTCGNLPPAETYTVNFIPRTDCPIDAGPDADANADADVDGGGDASVVSCDDAPDPYLCQRHCTQGSTTIGRPFECTRSADKKTVTCERIYLCGRRFEGLESIAPSQCEERDALGVFAAESAYLEAASVHAFRWMADEIAEHDLGAELVLWARRAAREEAQHARMMTSLARELGVACIPRVKRPARRARTLEEIAIENAVEGCVRETYGALLATYQAKHADDARVRSVFARIAKDETSHAELAWALAHAIDARLGDAARERVQIARMRAFAELRGALEGHLTPLAGHPPIAVERELVRSLEAALA